MPQTHCQTRVRIHQYYMQEKHISNLHLQRIAAIKYG